VSDDSLDQAGALPARERPILRFAEAADRADPDVMRQTWLD